MNLTFEAMIERLAASNARGARTEDAEGLRAAVAVVIRASAGAGEILFIKRAEREADPWSGHMAFPGGRRQTTDATLLDTARRETLEEIGLDLAGHANVIARLPDVMPYSRMPHALTVTAFVFALHAPSELTLNDEVAEAIWTPLAAVLANERATTFRWNKDGVDLQLPALDIDGTGHHIVWGLTYRMLELLREAAL